MCLRCDTVIKCKGSSTSGLMNRLKRHEIYINKRILDDGKESQHSSKKQKLEQENAMQYLKNESIGEILARCAAQDGFSFHAITNSQTIRGYVEDKGHVFPKSESTIIRLIMDFYEEKKMNLKLFLLI